MASDMSKAATSLECGVCLQPCQYPARLPCSHVFCYLCIKGIANRSGTCAFCRRPIPADFLDNPLILSSEGTLQSQRNGMPDCYAWFYQAKTSGWWQYQQRDSDELEAIYQENKEAVFDRLIAGFMYVIDFKGMIQYRKTDRSIYRHIKRDRLSIGDKVGVAGLRLPQAEPPRRTSYNAAVRPDPEDDDGAAGFEVPPEGTASSTVSRIAESPLQLQLGDVLIEQQPSGQPCLPITSPQEVFHRDDTNLLNLGEQRILTGSAGVTGTDVTSATCQDERSERPVTRSFRLRTEEQSLTASSRSSRRPNAEHNASAASQPSRRRSADRVGDAAVNILMGAMSISEEHVLPDYV